MEKALDLIEKLLDNFNLGRGVIYTQSALFIVVPVTMTLHLLCSKPLCVRQTINMDVAFIKNNFPYLLLLSYIFGFTLSSTAFAIYENKKKKGQAHSQNPSLNLNFCLLEKSGARQYFVSEYHRFFEAVYYIPYGMMIGLWCLSIYFFSGLALKGLGRENTTGWLIALVCSCVVSSTYTCFFKSYWMKNIVDTVDKVCEKAKKNLIEGVK